MHTLLFANGEYNFVILKPRNEQSAPVGALLMLAFTSGISCGLSAVETQHSQSVEDGLLLHDNKDYLMNVIVTHTQDTQTLT